MLPIRIHVCKRSLSKILSIPMALLYVVAGSAVMGARGAIMGAVNCVVPLCAIWFADDWGQRVGNHIRFHTVSSKTPAILMHLGGWLMLLGAPLMAAIINLR